MIARSPRPPGEKLASIANTAQVCAYRPGGACHSLDDARATHRPNGLPSVTLGFLLSSRNASQYHYAKWEERSRGTAALMRRAATQLDFALGQPLDVWVHVADAGWPELPLPINAAPRGVTLETVASSRARAGSLFPDYSLAGWEAIGYDHREHSLASFVDTLLLAGQSPTAAPLRPQAVFVGHEGMHPVRCAHEPTTTRPPVHPPTSPLALPLNPTVFTATRRPERSRERRPERSRERGRPQLRLLAQQWPAWLDVRRHL